ncbi:uncharacterized protein LOC128270316 [Anopheles cruzii]|uniref:uncharacterized protein LOC128270316 n=1 Tax=Anopheles cruzii TaxID=68878 RepID=UPI0022EC1BF3|nr:uncharacterized protein LOC128270316 [Anopheles cruzii]
MEASEKFEQFSTVFRGLCSFLGCDVMSESWRMDYRTYFMLFLCVVYSTGTLNAIIVAQDLFDLLKGFSFIGFFCQSLVKLYYTIRYQERYHINFSGIRSAIYDGHLTGTETQKRHILADIQLLQLLMKCTVVLYMSTLIIFSLYPAYMYFVVHVKVTILPLVLPGIDIYSVYGYGFTNAVHVFIALWGLLGALVSDTGFMMFVLHFRTYASLFGIDCGEFGKDLVMVESEELPEQEYVAFCRVRMREIYLRHQNVIAYVSSLNLCYETICSVQLATCSFSIMLNLFLALTTDWYATYSFLVVSVFQLLIFCILGAVIQVTNDGLNHDISSLPFYRLPPGEQHMFRLMLFRSQNPPGLFVRGVGPLNMQTFTDIMQKIYSSFAMMYSYLEEVGN